MNRVATKANEQIFSDLKLRNIMVTSHMLIIQEWGWREHMRT